MLNDGLKYLPFAILLLGISLFFLLQFRSKKKNVHQSSSHDQLYPVPSERGALTTYVKANYSKIELVKRRTMRSKKISKEMDIWLGVLGQRICEISVHAQNLNVREKFAAVFVVNHLFHSGYPDAEKIKNYFLRTIILYHRSEVRLKLVTHGKYASTYEISCNPWTTHLPKAVVETGALERPDKPNVAQKLH